MFQNLDFVVERLAQPRHQVGGVDVLFDAVGPSVEPALAPAGQVEHGFAQRLRRNRAGMDRYAADPAAFLHHQDRFIDLGRLDRSAPPGGPLPTTIMS